MCLAVPAQIVSVDGDSAVLEMGGVRVTGNVMLIEDPRPGDWVILHTGVALSRLDAEAAGELLQMLRTLSEAA